MLSLRIVKTDADTASWPNKIKQELDDLMILMLPVAQTLPKSNGTLHVFQLADQYDDQYFWEPPASLVVCPFLDTMAAMARYFSLRVSEALSSIRPL